MSESNLQNFYNYHIFARFCITTTDKGFVNKDNDSMEVTHWTGFYMRDNKSFCLDISGGNLIFT